MRTVLIVFMNLVSMIAWAGGGEIDSLLRVLDNDIARNTEYYKIKESRLYELKSRLSTTMTYEDRYDLNEDIYDEYLKFSSDSALLYIHENILLARHNGDFVRETDAMLSEAYLFICLGMYMEAKEILDEIDRKRLPESLLGEYYKYCKRLYTEASNGVPRNKITSSRYRQLAEIYRDSMMMVLPHTDDDYLQELMFSARKKKDYEAALKYNDIRMKNTKIGEPLYALVSYDSYHVYREWGGHTDEALRCLILSGISDVRSSIREQASIMQLAEILYKKGDIDRANAYINYSWEVIEAYNSRLRRWSHITPYSIITTGYKNIISQKNEQLRFYLFLTVFLAVFLSIALIYTYLMMKRQETMKNELKKLNSDLNASNEELSQSNKIKEVYIAHFFKLCTTYVDRAQSYRNMVNKKLRRGKIDELLKITSPANDTGTDELTELYIQFDKAFLQIFPNFVESVNQLLKQEERIILKEGELLTPELRICALMRLGFLKSPQIAELLHYSLTTVYNYRSRLKAKAVSHDDFENLVVRINS